MASTGRRSHREQCLFWIAWALGPGVLLAANFFVNPDYGRIWTPDARPFTVNAFETIVPFGCALSALSTLALCVLRGGPRRQPECWMLLLFWIVYAAGLAMQAATGKVIGGEVLVPLILVTGGLSLCVAFVRLLPTARATTAEPTGTQAADEARQ